MLRCESFGRYLKAYQYASGGELSLVTVKTRVEGLGFSETVVK